MLSCSPRPAKEDGMSEYKNAATFLVEKILALGAEGGEMLRTLKVIMDDRDSLRAKVYQLETRLEVAHSRVVDLEAANAELREAADRIEKEYPLSLEYAEDGRHAWPKRWKAIKQALARSTNSTIPPSSR